MRKNFLLFGLLSLGLNLHSQSLIYSEYFDNQNGKGALGSGTGAILDTSSISWSIDINQCSLSASTDWFQVQSNRLEARDIDGEAIWMSPIISTLGFQAWELTLNASEQGTLETTDYLITEFSIDGGAWQQTIENGYLENDFSSAQVAHFDEAGSSLQLRVRIQNNADTEYLQIDDIEVLAYHELLFSNGAWNRSPDENTASIDGRISSGSLVLVSQDFKLRNLIIENGAELRLNPAASIEIKEGIQNDGLMILHSGSALVQTASSDLNSGSGTYQVERSYLAPDHQRFSYWSSPIADAKMELVFASTNSLDRYEYLANSQSFSAYSSGNLDPGKAYACTPSQQSNGATNFNDSRIFNGTVNNGSLNLQISGISGGDWLLLGNPFPCPIDFQAFKALNPDLMGSVHFWDASTPQASGAAYASWNALGANALPFSSRGAPSSIIPAMQGFMVQIDPNYNGSSLNIQFDNSLRRSNQANNATFFKKESDCIKLWISFGDSLQAQSTLLAFHPKASDSIDPKYDAVLPFQSMGQLAISTFSKDSVLLSIQGQNAIGAPSSRLVDLVLKNSLYPGLQVKLDSVESPIPLQIRLIDRQSGLEFELKPDQPYVLQDTGTFLRRFQLEINGHDGFTNLQMEEDPDELLLLEDGEYWLLSGLSEQRIKLSVIDPSGRLLMQMTKDRHASGLQIPKQSIPNGLLFLVYQSESSQGVQKFYNSKP